LTILGVVSNGAFGMPAPKNLSPYQIAFYRAGHAHAGVLTLLALFLQIALDVAAIPLRLFGRLALRPLPRRCWFLADFSPLPTCARCADCFMRAPFWSLPQP
jgi:hypothetical protein